MTALTISRGDNYVECCWPVDSVEKAKPAYLRLRTSKASDDQQLEIQLVESLSSVVCSKHHFRASITIDCLGGLDHGATCGVERRVIGVTSVDSFYCCFHFVRLEKLEGMEALLWISG